MCLLLAPVFQGGFFFFAAAINSTNEANKAGGMSHIALLRCVWPKQTEKLKLKLAENSK
jgi:hypothetical protein